MKSKHTKIVLVSALILAETVSIDSLATTPDYSRGVFILNEDWYGHQNSTINYLTPDATDGIYMHYRVFQQENPGKELGCTAQAGAVFNGKLYIVAKQAKDPGASVTGGRLTIADARTLKVEAQLEEISNDGSRADGRGFLGVTDHKGYVSSSDGIWILDLDARTITGKVEGSGNPNAGGNSSVTNPSGSLYHGQTGSMALAAGRVFAAHQSAGVLVVDPETDAVISTISVANALMDAGVWTPSEEDLADIAGGWVTLEECAPGIGTVVRAADGNVWCTLAGDINGTGSTYPALMCLDPETLKVETVKIPEDVQSPTTSWYAWTPDTFSPATDRDEIYYAGGDRWFGRTRIYRFNTSARTFSKIIDLDEEGYGWKLYGCSMRPDPRDGTLYMSLYQDNQSQSYITRRYSSEGKLMAEYPMIENYWFPSQPIFPEAMETGVGNIADDIAATLRFVDGKLRWEKRKPQVFNLSGTSVAVDEDGKVDGCPGFYVATDGETAIRFMLSR